MSGEHERFLREALALAERGRGLVSPNPMVGAVIVSGRHVVGRGYHKAFGLQHAEVEALREAGARAKGATMYVTLEPCNHQGKTPPCTEALIKAGIKEVVCCMRDPNPQVAGRGFEELEENGIKVRSGWLEGEAERLNESYLVNVLRNRPFVVLKWAQSIDGKIATGQGVSKWITSPEAREYARKFRFACDAVAVGVGTVLADDPFLDYDVSSFQAKREILERKRYRKVVLDTGLRTPLTGHLFEDAHSEVLLCIGEDVPEERVMPYRRPGCEILRVARRGAGLDIAILLKELFTRDIGVLLVEGGGKVLTSFWETGAVDRAMIYLGNRFMGGEHSISPLGGISRPEVARMPYLEEYALKRFGDDLLLEGKVCFPE